MSRMINELVDALKAIDPKYESVIFNPIDEKVERHLLTSTTDFGLRALAIQALDKRDRILVARHNGSFYAVEIIVLGGRDG